MSVDTSVAILDRLSHEWRQYMHHIDTIAADARRAIEPFLVEHGYSLYEDEYGTIYITDAEGVFLQHTDDNEWVFDILNTEIPGMNMRLADYMTVELPKVIKLT